jgi:hypothetical protein
MITHQATGRQTRLADVMQKIEIGYELGSSLQNIKIKTDLLFAPGEAKMI